MLFFAPSSPAIVARGAEYLTIIAISQVFLALEIVLDEGLSGSGDTVPPLLIVGTVTLARVPLAFLLAGPCGFGVLGVFWAVAISTIIKGVLMWFWFRRGTWVDRGAVMTESSAALD
jgi:Na+-driven multidrug efflux pump